MRSLPRLMDPADQFAFIVGLTEIQLYAEAIGVVTATLADLGKAFGAIGALGIQPVKIGIRAIEKDDASRGHNCLIRQPMPSRTRITETMSY